MVYIERIQKSKTQDEAVRILRDVLDNYSGRIANSRKKTDDIYAGKTPVSPYIEFALSDRINITQSQWVDTPYKKCLDSDMQAIVQNLELLPCYDYVPYVNLSGIEDAGYIAGLFGTQYINHGASGIEITKNAIQSPDEVETLCMPLLDSDGRYKQAIEHTAFLAEALEGAVDIVYPQFQGPSTNSLRILPEEHGLIGVLTHPEKMEVLAIMVTKLIIEFICGLFKTAGGPQFFRPRARFCQPGHVKGLLVDDWISVMSPSSYKAVYASSYELMNAKIGSLFLHTCGPVLKIIKLLGELGGLEGFEAAFINRQDKSTGQLLKMKEAMTGQYTFCSFGLPDGRIVSDEENLTPEIFRELSENGHFAMQASGTLKYSEQLTKQLGL